MSDLQHVEWEDCFVEERPSPALERAVETAVGFPMPVVRYFSDCPWVVRSLIALFPEPLLVFTSLQLSELIALVVSQDNSCRFCYASTRMALRLLGMSERRIEDLEGDLSAAPLSAAEKAVLDSARRISRANPLAGREEWKALRQAGLEDLAAKEVVFLAVCNVFFNRVMTLPAVPLKAVEEEADTWRFRLMAPLARMFLRRRRRARRMAKAPESNGPYSYLVRALDGLPAAGALHDVLQDAFASPVLAKRTKAMVFAVVARGLGCPIGEREALRLLAEEGFGEADAQEMLSRLVSPKLDPIESAIVPFARETIWYRPAQIQRRGRELRARLRNDQFVELAGIAALANAVCRMTLIVDPPPA